MTIEPTQAAPEKDEQPAGVVHCADEAREIEAADIDADEVNDDTYDDDEDDDDTPFITVPVVDPAKQRRAE